MLAWLFMAVWMMGTSAVADPVAQLTFTAQAHGKSYGLYLAAPHGGCTFVRYRLEATGMRPRMIVMQAGEGRLVRLGSSFAPGAHQVLIDALGCAQSPQVLRAVVLRKGSPDHGARALAHGAGQANGDPRFSARR